MEPAVPHSLAERRMRELLDKAGLPAPDHVEYEELSIYLYWDAPKLVVEIDLADAPNAAR